MGNLDFAFLNADIISKFVLKGFLFSIELTVIATVGGIVFGTILALMRDRKSTRLNSSHT